MGIRDLLEHYAFGIRRVFWGRLARLSLMLGLKYEYSRCMGRLELLYDSLCRRAEIRKHKLEMINKELAELEKGES